MSNEAKIIKADKCICGGRVEYTGEVLDNIPWDDAEPSGLYYCTNCGKYVLGKALKENEYVE